MADIFTKISKSSVDKAGDQLRQTSTNNEVALNTLAAWRSQHVYALDLAFKLLKKYTNKVGNKAIYGQRLKRIPSILSKLKRFPQAKLSRLQDIGGCRVILSDYNRLRALSILLKKNKSILSNYKDYITYPKNDGYRSMHLIYSCGSKKPEYSGLKIELQLRTKLQHAWATTVEIVDTFEQQNLKLGQGDLNWQKFFYLVGEEFALLEQLPVHDNNIKRAVRLSQIKQLCDQLQVIEKLSSYVIITSHILDLPKQGIKNANFFVLVLKLETKPHSGAGVMIEPFKNQIQAQEFYLMSERAFLNNPRVNILMIKADPIKQIKKAYPNYFADSHLFLQELGKLNKSRTE